MYTTCELGLRKVGKVAAQSFADRIILLENNKQLRKSIKGRVWKPGDRSQLSKARVLDTGALEELVSQREAKLQEAAEKAEKRAARKTPRPQNTIRLGDLID